MWKALVYATLIIMMHIVLGDNWAVRLLCLWARPYHCRRARAAVSLHLSIICKKESNHEQHVDTHRLVYTASFPNSLGSSYVMFIISQNAVLCLWTPESRWRWFWTGQLPGSISEGPGVQGFNFRTALPLLQAPDSKTFRLICLCNGSQSVLRGSQGVRNQFAGDQRINFCNGYFEVPYLLMKGTMFC